MLQNIQTNLQHSNSIHLKTKGEKPQPTEIFSANYKPHKSSSYTTEIVLIHTFKKTRIILRFEKGLQEIGILMNC